MSCYPPPLGWAMERKTESETAAAASTTTTNTNIKKDEVGGGGGGYNRSNVKKAELQSTLRALLEDPILLDVPKKPSLQDVDTLINLEFGSAMRITIHKLDGSSFDVAVMNSASLKDLKVAIMKKVNDVEQSQMGHRHISWKHLWANYCLLHHNDKLLDDNLVLQNYGIRNNSQVRFIPYVKLKGLQRHSKRRRCRLFRGCNKVMLS